MICPRTFICLMLHVVKVLDVWLGITEEISV